MTPETDSKSSDHIGFWSCATVPTEFARKLERERDEARKRIADDLDNTPLAALIDVARAAAQLVTVPPSVTHHNYEALLTDALIALRETGKAEWL